MKRLTYDPLVALVQTLDDGIEFYRTAEEKTASDRLQTVFSRMVEIREFALAYIQPYMTVYGRSAMQVYGVHGKFGNRYAPLLNDVIADESLVLVRQIEEHLIDAMQSAIVETQNALVASILRDLSLRVAQNADSAALDPMHLTQPSPGLREASRLYSDA